MAEPVEIAKTVVNWPTDVDNASFIIAIGKALLVVLFPVVVLFVDD